MLSWLVRNKRWLLAITAAVASLPLLPEWARTIVSAGSGILDSFPN